METKTCKRCSRAKLPEDFSTYVNGRGKAGHRGVCKQCCRENDNRTRMSKVDPYPIQYKKQKGLCALCDKRSNRKLVLDYNASGTLRGLLCAGCIQKMRSIQLDDIIVRRILERFDDPALGRIARYWLGELEPTPKG